MSLMRSSSYHGDGFSLQYLFTKTASLLFILFFIFFNAPSIGNTDRTGDADPVTAG